MGQILSRGTTWKIGKTPKEIVPVQETLNTQSFISNCLRDFTKNVVAAFLEADIPLYKLQHASIKKLFNSNLGKHCPSESTCRSHVNELAAKKIERLKELFAGKAVILVVDEAEVSGQKYVNILAGLIEAGAARSEGCKGCSLPSLSPPYFFLRSKIFLPILVFHTTIDNIFFEKNNFCTKTGNT